MTRSGPARSSRVVLLKGLVVFVAFWSALFPRAGLAETVRRLSGRSREVKKMGRNGRAFVEARYSRQGTAEAVEAVLKGVCRRGS